MKDNEYITFTKISPQKYDVIFENGVKLGEFLQNVDGYLVFFPELGGGYWESWVMRMISDKIDELNKPWDEEINRYFEERKKMEGENTL